MLLDRCRASEQLPAKVSHVHDHGPVDNADRPAEEQINVGAILLVDDQQRGGGEPVLRPSAIGNTPLSASGAVAPRSCLIG